MYLTPQEYEVQSALNRFWDANYTQEYTADERNQLAEDFTLEWLDPSKIKIDKPFIRHPATRKRERSRSCTVADVLADFIMRVDQVAERQQEYPVTNPDRSVRDDRDRMQKERSIFFQYEMDAMVEGDVMPSGLVTELQLADDSIEDILFAEVAPDIEAFRQELRRVKQNAEFYTTTLAEKYGYQRKDVLRRIRKLDLSRVRECKVCGSAFYAHDYRRHICDMQQGIVAYKEGDRRKYKLSDKSACELENERKTALNRGKTPILAEENSII
ncbi:hypothetical protein [Bacillus mesophilum]|uniref:Uncharacterized protein n=1 Tax=Bacillus mesophilum TaxID=1071718 RepID=A0A7V7UVE4_9BACI|nr:hypothetical protein [Bacillus mesophilum]KAB2332927.1 hypothetical protein F7732_12665 [Bacillus mesophilum]